MTRTFANRVAVAAAAAVAACSVLFVQRADFGRYAADVLPATVSVAAGFFVVTYVAVCLGAVLLEWVRGPRRTRRG